VRVRHGQRLRPRPVIGDLGNSGSSSGPHLHMQMMTRPSLLFSDGLPLVFDRFDLTGTTAPLTDELFAAINARQPIPIDPTGAGPRRRELPPGRQVVSFPGG
jgi:murein DD-endopeptidase MepM/ murein hydrolase activator NlpD